MHVCVNFIIYITLC